MLLGQAQVTHSAGAAAEAELWKRAAAVAQLSNAVRRMRREARLLGGSAPQLHVAANNMDVGTVRALIVAGNDVNEAASNGLTPLHYASLSGCSDCVRALISAGATCNAQDAHGMTPLHYAIIENNSECISLLISNGADVDAGDNVGNRPLHYAYFLQGSAFNP